MACRPDLARRNLRENECMSKPKQHDPLCPVKDEQPCQCALIGAVEDRMYEAWIDADAYHASGLTA